MCGGLYDLNDLLKLLTVVVVNAQQRANLMSSVAFPPISCVYIRELIISKHRHVLTSIIQLRYVSVS